VVRVQLNDPNASSGKDARILTREKDIVRACNSSLSQRFQLGKRAPASFGTLNSDLGGLSNTAEAESILDGSYAYPKDGDIYTAKLFQEMARCRQLQDTGHPLAGWNISVEDFIEYWRTAKERTSSSLFGRHFGHYKAASFSPPLAALHVGSINLAVRFGPPLTRWQHGVTVLLEKELGNIYIGKLRAICLLEGDFNWFLKLTFSKRMMAQMQANEMLPNKQIATKG
jgi:hypothetical protein